MATGKKPVAELFSDLSLMVNLPKKIGNGWKNLLRRLGLTQVDIDHINHNHQDLADKIGDGLARWNREKENTSYWTRTNQLLEVLRAEDMTTLAEELEDEYCITEQEPEDCGIIPDVVQNSPEFSDEIINTEISPKSSDGNTINKGYTTGDGSAQTFLTETGPGINEDFSLRSYQTEIAKDGLRGENSIIWAGTGSGKTRVAVYIMKKHLDQKPTGRIAFFTTTVTLLDQQYKAICELLPKYKHQIRMFSGKDQIGERLSGMVQERRVCVLTPAILGNCLNSGSIPLHVFSMLVFDECHHTRKNEPYNQIMAHYRKLHQNDSAAAKLPQIIGLTASVGTERALDVKGAEESILELMARMDVSKIATPRDNMKEYKEYISDPIRRSEAMKDRKTDPVKDTIERAMKQLENWLHTKVGVLDKDVHHLLLEMPCEHRMEQQYQSWLSRLRDALPISKELKSDGIHQANVVAQHLKMYHTALCVNNVLCMKSVVDHLKRSSLTNSILKGEKKNEVVISYSSQHKTELNNTGVDNTGSYNTGVDITGSYNTGVDNTGVDNTGSYNTGVDNTGVDNTGVDISGSYNTGMDITGSYNTGVDNTGSFNTGDDNTGRDNTGIAITGSDNTNISNTGNDKTIVDNAGSDNASRDNTGSDNASRDNTESDNADATLFTLYEEVVKELECLSMSKENENPNIVRLQEMVDGIFREKGKDSTFIVFVETREFAKGVSEYLNVNSDFAKCWHLKSSRTTTEEDQRQSLVKRKGVVERLRANELNGLVATPVAEEGLDIPLCNFVIRYNKSSNEISTLQTAGRSRAREGTVIDFADTQKRKQEEVNMMRLTFMNQALENILSKPIDEIAQTVAQRMYSLTIAEAEEERNRQAQMESKKQSNFTLRCLKCEVVAVSSCDIRCYIGSQYIVVGREFYNKVKRKPNKKFGKYDGMIPNYKIYCKHCGDYWGVGACNDSSVFFAVLNIQQYIARDDDTGIEYTHKAWKKLPFTVQPMAEEDFASLAGVEDLVEHVQDS